MGQQNKWVGGGRVGVSSKAGKAGYASQVQAQYAHLSPSTKGGGDFKNVKVANYSAFGSDNNANTTRSSHNDINRFTAGIQQGQYQNPEQPYHRAYKQSNTESKSQFETATKPSRKNDKVGNKKIAAPNKYNPRTPNLMKPNSTGKFLDKSQTMNKLAKSLKRSK